MKKFIFNLHNGFMWYSLTSPYLFPPVSIYAECFWIVSRGRVSIQDFSSIRVLLHFWMGNKTDLELRTTRHFVIENDGCSQKASTATFSDKTTFDLFFLVPALFCSSRHLPSKLSKWKRYKSCQNVLSLTPFASFEINKLSEKHLWTKIF